MDYVATERQLQEVVSAYLEFDEFVFDVETLGVHRADPRRNEVFWISLAGPGRADVIPCGHPLGELLSWPDDELHRVHPTTKKLQERRINPASGREKWFDVPQPFSPPPPQLWVSQVMAGLEPLFFSQREARRVIGQNVKFDLESVAKYYGGRVPPPPYGDTLIAAKLVDENQLTYRLGDLVKRAFKFEYEKIGRTGPEKFPFSEARMYSFYDAKYTWLLWRRYEKLLVREGLQHIFDLEMELLPVIIDMEMTGTPIDVNALKQLGDEFSMEMARLQVALNKAAGWEINLNASRQVAKLVYDVRGHRCEVFTEKTGEPSTSKDTLQSFKSDKVVAQILEYSQLQKLYGTFVKGLLESQVDGRIYPSFNQVGTVSGRASCSNPNLQQIPSRSERGKKIRSVFVASPDHTLIIADLSQIELRMLAHYTRDPELLRAYRENVDLHGMTAAVVFGDDYTDIQRSYAKNANFCVPVTTQALTSTGWKYHHEIQKGDLVLGYADGQLIWTPVLDVFNFDEAEVFQIKNNHFSAVTTAEHRWVGESRRSTRVDGHSVHWWERSEITTASLKTEDRIFLSAPLKAMPASLITEAEAGLIAWLWTDGATRESSCTLGRTSQAKGKKVGVQAQIYQSKPEGVKEIQSLLSEIGCSYRHEIRKSRQGKDGCDLRPIQVWTLNPSYARDLLQRARLQHLSPTQFVISLGTQQLARFVSCAWMAEGWTDQCGCKIMAQNEGDIFEALTLAVFLSGHHAQICRNSIYEGTANFNIRFGKPYMSGQRIQKKLLGSAPVWCLQTELGSWVMRQGDQIMLTGNSVLYGAGARTLVAKYGVANIRTAERLLSAFYHTYRRVQPWKEFTLRQARIRYKKGASQPYVETILGRRRRLPELLWADDHRRGAAERQAISVTISGSAADLFKVIMINVWQAFREADIGARILNTVHDELVAEVPSEHAQEALAIMKREMEEVVNPFTGEPFLSVPIIADAKLAKHWGEK